MRSRLRLIQSSVLLFSCCIWQPVYAQESVAKEAILADTKSDVEQHTKDSTIDNEQWLQEKNITKNLPDTFSVQSQSLRRADGTPLSLGFVNLRRIMASIPQLASLRAKLDSEFAQQKVALDKQADEIQALDEQLANMPRGDAYSSLEKQAIAKRRAFARLDASFRDAYNVRRNEELATLQQLVVDEIVALAKEQGYDVILNDTGVIYVSPNADLTPFVIQRLQNRAKQGQNER